MGLFGPRKNKVNPFDVRLGDANVEPIGNGISVSRQIWVLGNRKNKALPKADAFEKLPPLANLRNQGYNVSAEVDYVDFTIRFNDNEETMIDEWNKVLNIFKGTDESEVDDLILVGLTFAPIMESRRVFLEKVNEAIGTDIDRYEHIRRCLEFWAPVNTQQGDGYQFHHWAKV